MKTAEEMRNIVEESANLEIKIEQFKQNQLKKWYDLNIDHIMEQIEHHANLNQYRCDLVDVFYKRDYYRVLYLVDHLVKAGYKCEIDMSPENREEFYTINVNWEK